MRIAKFQLRLRLDSLSPDFHFDRDEEQARLVRVQPRATDAPAPTSTLTNLRSRKLKGIAPTAENVLNDTYALTRYLYLYTVDKPHGATKDFIDWAITPAGQKIVRDVGYFPIWKLP